MSDEIRNEKSDGEEPSQLDAAARQDAGPEDYTEVARAVVLGEVLQEWPTDLFIPPDALEVVLESFQGPLDLLLYLIRKQNLDILDIPVADITRQYMSYVEMMHVANLDLAAEYLVMAALLAEIKSRMLLPRPASIVEDEEDPRAALVRRLQEYERFSQASQEIEDLPREGRDVFVAHSGFDDPEPTVVEPRVTLNQLSRAFERLLERAEANKHLHVNRETLSMRERMTSILKRLQTDGYVRFEDLFTANEGRLGVVVTFIAVLELFRDDMLVVVQAEPFAAIHIKAAA
jgi:segregation and condensation protein A